MSLEKKGFAIFLASDTLRSSYLMAVAGRCTTVLGNIEYDLMEFINSVKLPLTRSIDAQLVSCTKMDHAESLVRSHILLQ